MGIINCLTKGNRKVQNYPNVPFQQDQQNWKSSGMHKDHHSTSLHCESYFPCFQYLYSHFCPICSKLFSTQQWLASFYTQKTYRIKNSTQQQRNILILSSLSFPPPSIDGSPPQTPPILIHFTLYNFALKKTIVFSSLGSTLRYEVAQVTEM